MDHFICWNGVNREVLKGIKLREEKIRLCPIPKEHDVINVALTEPSCSKTPAWCNINKSGGKLYSTQEYEFSRNFTDVQKCTNVKKKRKKILSNKPFRRGKTRCPLRVAELSVPTKRHCLETWRNNKDVLSTFMIERLRQIIMDEKPIVKIYDAIDCFKRQKTSKSRSPKLHTKSKQVDQLRIFSALLSYKIMHKLLRPQSLTLNSQLKRLSRVVNDEIRNIINGSRKSKLYLNNNIQAEISDKITLWIVSVLEESAYKILLEDFEELREKEGSVWDLIDDLIDNVVVICEPTSIASSCENKPSLLSISKATMNEEQSVVNEASDSKHDDILSNSEDTRPINTVDSIIAEILDKIIYDEELQNPSIMSIVDFIDNTDVSIDENLTNSYGSILDVKRSNEYLTGKETSSVHDISLTENDSQINISDNVEDITNKEEDFESDHPNVNITDLEKDIFNITETNKEIEHNIDETSPVNIENTGSQIEVLKEETPDDSIKKVKFSNLNIGVNVRKTSISTDSNSLFIREEYDIMPIMYSKDESIKSELRFAPPNDHLLSPADESWPENIQFPVLKATVSVSKSILSLGKILESEEKLLFYDEKDPLNYKRKGSINGSIETEINDEIEKSKTEKFRQKSCNSEDKYYHKNSAPDLAPSHVGVIQKDILDTGERTDFKNNVKNMNVEHMPIIDINPIEIKNKQIALEEATQTERVALEKVSNHIHSTGDFLTCSKHYDKTKVTCSCANFKEGYNRKDIDVGKWCYGLENVMQNLEIWRDWIEKTCNCVMILKYRGGKKEMARKFKEDYIYMWTKLKSNVDSDSRIWRKVSKKLKSGMTNHRSCYFNHKV